MSVASTTLKGTATYVATTINGKNVPLRNYDIMASSYLFIITYWPSAIVFVAT